MCFPSLGPAEERIRPLAATTFRFPFFFWGLRVVVLLVNGDKGNGAVDRHLRVVSLACKAARYFTGLLLPYRSSCVSICTFVPVKQVNSVSGRRVDVRNYFCTSKGSWDLPGASERCRARHCEASGPVAGELASRAVSSSHILYPHPPPPF